jgi:MoaA/NifB/PqqE/SkfB family radical SAM enzyme
LENNELRAFHDIEFSLDYPTQAEQDAQRGPGNWELIHRQAERCVRLGVPVTIIAVMMKANYLRLADVARRGQLRSRASISDFLRLRAASRSNSSGRSRWWH